VDFPDFARFRSVFGSHDADANLDGSGTVNFADLALFRSLFGRAPRPPATHP
jgi:hypothetical protein